MLIIRLFCICFPLWIISFNAKCTSERSTFSLQTTLVTVRSAWNTCTAFTSSLCTVIWIKRCNTESNTKHNVPFYSRFRHQWIIRQMHVNVVTCSSWIITDIETYLSQRLFLVFKTVKFFTHKMEWKEGNEDGRWEGYR